MQIKAKVIFKNIGAGVWLLEAEDGNHYQPTNLQKKFQQENIDVNAEIEIVEGGMSVFMAGKIVKIKKIEII
ncbi:MAG: hypothetical protein EAZ44_02465 [Cytophagia bacterium]|nr:MAG: hypothetical protein EAZ44_02465 [Cytophagia bacterium]TAH30804.1 MAG: hypothetical protein EAZ06_01865 [Cytophagales bacterium]